MATATARKKRRADRLAGIRERKLAEADARFRVGWGDRKPAYGDPEQIRLLREWRHAVAEAEREHAEAVASPGLREYRISFQDVTVYAMSEDEAEEIAADDDAPRVDMVRDMGEAPDDAEEGIAW